MSASPSTKRSCEYRRTASAIRKPFAPLSTARPERVSEPGQNGSSRNYIISFKRGRQKTRSAPHSSPHSTPPRLSLPPAATVSQSRVCICHSQRMRFCPLDLLSLIVRLFPTPTRAAAALLMILLQHNGRLVVKARSIRGCGARVRCYADALCEECTRVYL